jgi:hypothetical protein
MIRIAYETYGTLSFLLEEARQTPMIQEFLAR